MDNVRTASLLSASFFLICLIQTSEASHNVWTEEEYDRLVQSVSVESKSASYQGYRTGYHFQPAKNWMNDPNAPMFYKGYYHLFYQYNPKGPVWGKIVWGHAVSRDLINWKYLAKAALEPDRWFDINGCWSGSATLVKGTPMILYTGSSNAQEQIQILAVPKDPSDPLLREWKKVPGNPVMLPGMSVGINSSSFRDPTTAWVGADRRWRVLVGNKKDRERGAGVGVALLYTSKDFINWKKAKHPIHSAMGTGMWECPDFFPLRPSQSHSHSRVKYVLKNSLDDYKVDYYTVGRYFPEVDRYVPDSGSVEGPNGLRYDYGKFYASKSFYDNQNRRRILWGWINESDSVTDDIAKGWASLQAIPRVVRLDSSGTRLILWPVAELEALRGHKVSKHNVVLERRSVIKMEGLKSAAQVDVEVEFELPEKYMGEVEVVQDDPAMSGMTAQSFCKTRINRGFGLMVLASNDLKERTLVFFTLYKHKSHTAAALCVDHTRSTLRTGVDKAVYGGFVNVLTNHKSLSLRILVDHSIVESFAEGGRACITSRSYPTMAVNENAHLFVFNNNGNSPLVLRRLTAWHMKDARRVYGK